MTTITPAATRHANQNRLAFTPFALKRIPVPPAGEISNGRAQLVQVDYWDNSTPGFGLRITSMGTKSWICMTRLVGQSTVKRFTLGPGVRPRGPGRVDPSTGEKRSPCTP